MLASMSYSKHAYLVMASSFAVLFAIIWIFVFWGTHEIPYENTINTQKTTVKSKLLEGFKSFGTAFKNKSFRAQLGLFVFAFAALDILMAFSAYFVNEYLNNPKLLPYVSAMWISQMCVLPIYVLIANKYSKATAYKIGAIIWILAMLVMFTLTPSNATSISMAIHFALIGIGLSPCYMTPMAMISFVTEVDVLMTKKRRTGIYAGAVSFARKMSQGIFILPSLGIILSAIGYQKGVDIQSASTLFDLRMVFILVPIILISIGYYFATKFHVNPHNFNVINNEINRLENGGKKEDVAVETKQVCELLTGKKYEELYN